MNKPIQACSRKANWLDRYMAIPFEPKGRTFDGCDCWGLMCLLQRHECGVELPHLLDDYDAPEVGDARLADLVRRTSLQEWREVTIVNVQFGDGLVFRMMNEPIHIAFAINATQMVHTRKNVGVLVESFTAPQWASRLVGAYRYATG